MSKKYVEKKTESCLLYFITNVCLLIILKGKKICRVIFNESMIKTNMLYTPHIHTILIIFNFKAKIIIMKQFPTKTFV